MDGWALAGWAMIYCSATILVGQIFRLTGDAKKMSFGSLATVFVVGYVVAALNGGLPKGDRPSPAWGILLIWLAFVAAIGMVGVTGRWHARYKAIRLQQKAEAQAAAAPPTVPPAPTLPPTITCPAFDVLVRYVAKGKAPEHRRVTVHTLHIKHNEAGRPVVTQFAGYCHLRHGPRTFNVTGIVEMADAETGEVVADHSEWLLNRALPD